MTEGGFQKVGHSQRCLHGPRKVLLCGFGPGAQPKFKNLLQMLGMEDLPLVWAGDADGDEKVGALVNRDANSGEGCVSGLPRAVIMAGITEQELHQLMSGCRQAGMRQALWAALTPSSEQWPLRQLLKELSAERDALADNDPSR
ncbi:DUF3783 domain-containing protein [Desulfatitalea alkaliphila]|uniref:DUF3783 domain-containing protein n=1 Tax=Desulfatitalea alkaliphila TaxID=2929485 RepID=A0AA41UL28_9BACT|nr:DUF3783 domain-containing protein [Desulfatitalea alkaliphila]MCJ8502047.1 DUF3783 domain-containing protein [Desulfatitalea alkaliphila]